MRKIDLQTWRRAKHFRLYSAFDDPHVNLCANVDLTAFYPYVKQNNISFNIAIVYVLARVANASPEFRYRIRSGEVVEHEVVHPSTTILTNEDLFAFCTFEFVEPFSSFAAAAAEQIAYVQAHPTLEDEPGRDDLLFMTAIPWVSFTAIKHAMHLHPADSVPRLAWGKLFAEGERWKMPLSVQGHHALVDGIHAGRYYAQVQEEFDRPEVVLS